MNPPGPHKTAATLTAFLLGILIFIYPVPPAYAAEPETLKVALTGKYPPFSMYNKTGKLAGFDVDVSGEVARRLNRKLVLVPTEWDGIIAGLLAGKYDAIIGSMAITVERSRMVDFSMPYYESGAQLFVHRDLAESIRGIDDCEGRRIGVVLGETYEHYLRDGHPAVETVTYKSTVDIFRDVSAGRLVGFVSDRLLGSYQIRQEGMPFVRAGPLLYTEKMGIPVAKGRSSLLAGINGVLEEMKRDGTLGEIHNKWFALDDVRELKEMEAVTIARLLGYGFAITLAVAGASILLGFMLAVPQGLILNSSTIPGRRALRAFNDFIRGTPVLIQLFFVYFGLASWVSSRFNVNISAYTAAVFTLSLNASAYMAEVVRSGLMSVDQGQRDAARALGLTRVQAFVSVVWPQAFRIALPPLMNSVVALIKDTALVSVITVPEVIRQAQSIISVTFNPTRYYFMVAIMFFVVTFPLMKLSALAENKIKKRGFLND